MDRVNHCMVLFWCRLLPGAPHPRTNVCCSLGLMQAFTQLKKWSELLENCCDLWSSCGLKWQWGTSPPHPWELSQISCRSYRLFFPKAWTYRTHSRQRDLSMHILISDTQCKQLYRELNRNFSPTSILFLNSQYTTIRRTNVTNYFLMIISKQKALGRCHVPGDSAQYTVRVRNLIIPTCSQNLPAYGIGLGSIAKEMETLFILIRLLEQGHLYWKAIGKQAQVVTRMPFNNSHRFCRNSPMPITRTKVNTTSLVFH